MKIKPVIRLNSILLIVLFFVNIISAQQLSNTESIAVLNIDSKGFTLEPSQMGNIARTELNKLHLYEVMDQYDRDYVLAQKGKSIEGCYGKLCLIDMGKALKTDKILGGSVELYSETIIITLRLIDVGLGTVEKTQVVEFLDLRHQVQTMIGITLKSLLGQEVDQDLQTKLTKKFDYESAINMPQRARLRLNGPRMGFTVLSGEIGKIYSSPRNEDGFNASRI